MPEVLIKYRSSKTLQALKDFAKYFRFIISPVETKRTSRSINGVTIIPGDNSIDLSRLKKTFTGKNIDSKELRDTAWRRKK
jgi:hypothetical protein